MINLRFLVNRETRESFLHGKISCFTVLLRLVFGPIVPVAKTTVVNWELLHFSSTFCFLGYSMSSQCNSNHPLYLSLIDIYREKVPKVRGYVPVYQR